MTYKLKGGIQMHLTITPEAAARMEQFVTADENHAFYLIYDTEGCGCAVNGVPTLKWQSSEPHGPMQFVQLCELPHPVYVSTHDALFFEDAMKLAFDSSTFCFKLSGTGQIYHHCLTVK
jgi:uncharacterized protein YqkB